MAKKKLKVRKFGPTIYFPPPPTLVFAVAGQKQIGPNLLPRRRCFLLNSRVQSRARLCLTR